MAKELLADIPEYAGEPGQKKKRPRTVAVVMEGHCTGCEVCVPFCPVDCIEVQPKSAYPDRPIPPVQIRFDECIGCQICVKACTKLTWDAIRMVPTEKIETAFGIKIGNTYEEATKNVAAKNLDAGDVRKISNSAFVDYWRG
ncbi:MAG TPA: 4Fe-4S dicluster domain-containing protein [Bdellovibrionota bacterium]|nr:4Fe-4S dicluster domain-containing protein [Bdellovibrionota bacterium]